MRDKSKHLKYGICIGSAYEIANCICTKLDPSQSPNSEKYGLLHCVHEKLAGKLCLIPHDAQRLRTKSRSEVVSSAKRKSASDIGPSSAIFTGV